MTTKTAAPPMLAEEIRDARARRRDDMSPDDWLVPLFPRCVAELDAVASQLRRDPLPALA